MIFRLVTSRFGLLTETAFLISASQKGNAVVASVTSRYSSLNFNGAISFIKLDLLLQHASFAQNLYANRP